MSGWEYVEERPTIAKGARVLVCYSDDRPDETFVIDDVHDNGDGSQTLDVHLDGLDDPGTFVWHPANDESPAPPPER